MTARYALFFAPPAGSAWWAFGSHWLGYDAASGQALAQPAITGVTREAFHALTSEPRRYGFHATLKPPIRLAEGVSPDGLQEALEHFCEWQQPFVMPPFTARRLGGFIACVPAVHEQRIHDLADACVRGLDRFRAPPRPSELERRRVANLTPRQAANLAQWGYPYVLEEYRFHFTLTGPLAGASAAEADAVLAAANAALEPLNREPMRCNAVCLFVQPEARAKFRLAARMPFGA